MRKPKLISIFTLSKGLILSSLTLFSLISGVSLSFAANPPDAKQVLEVIQLARDPEQSKSFQYQAAEHALNYLRSQAAKNLQPGDSSSALLTFYIKDPTLIEKLGLNKTDGLGRISSEFSSLIRQMAAEKELGACSTFATGVRSEVLAGARNYSSCAENSWNYQVYNLPASKSRKTSQKYASVPNFVYTDNLSTLIQTTGLATYYPGEKIGDGKSIRS